MRWSSSAGRLRGGLCASGCAARLRLARATAPTAWALCLSHRWASDAAGDAAGEAAGAGGGARPSYWHQPGAEPLQAVTVGQLAERAASRWPSREAVVSCLQRRRLTFAQALTQMDQLAAGFLAIGLKPGDRIGIWGPNSIEWYLTGLAASRAGLVLVTINPAYQAPELQYCLEKVKIKALVAADTFKSQNYYRLVESVAPELKSCQPGMLKSEKIPSLDSLIMMGENNFSGAFRFNDVLESASASSIRSIADMQSDIEPDQPTNIQFTSGTTGKPKAAVLSHFNVVNNSYLVGKRLGLSLSGPHRICLQVPLFHCYGYCNGILAALHHGSTLVLPGPQFTAQTSLDAIQKENCTFIYGTPTMYVDLVNLINKSSQPPKTSIQMVLTSGAPCSPNLFQQIQQSFNLEKVVSVYGQTEASPVVFQSLFTDKEDHMLNTIGYVSDHVEAKVVDKAGKMVPLGSPGELWIRGYFKMLGYWEDKAKTDEMITTDGWMKTGDQFVLREDGYGQVVGRIKDVIIRGGENIYPKEVEDFLETHPEILEAQIFGIPDERLGEVVYACIRLSKPNVLKAEDIKQFCKGQIAYYKIPSIIKFVEDFPKTLSGKIQKFRLKEQVLKDLH